MGKISSPERVKLIVGLISNDEATLNSTCKALEKNLKNNIDFKSEVIGFSYTEYYKEEMGDGLKRAFLSFKKLMSPDDAAKTKLITNRIEDKLRRNGKRTINIDPGYIDMAKLVLFSTKDYSHRIYVGSGIFAEVTLHYKDKHFNFWPWTYPDYKSEEYMRIFEKIRETYKNARG